MTAIISACGTYRYTLERPVRNHVLTAKPRTILWVMLNPSTADANQDDPTIRQCLAFSERWGFDRLLVGNLFAYRATKPTALWSAHKSGTNIIGESAAKADEHLNHLANRADRVVIAWGAHAERMPERANHVQSMLMRGHELYALGWTKLGHPWHPLMRAHNLELLRC